MGGGKSSEVKEVATKKPAKKTHDPGGEALTDHSIVDKPEKPAYEKGSADKRKVLPDAGTMIVTHERRSDDERDVLEIPPVEETLITAQLVEAKFAAEKIQKC